MTAKKCSTPFGYVIFCDEVRFESNGKQFFIGVYNHEMIVPSNFPIRLRNFAIVANFAERPKESRDDLKFVVSYTGMDEPIAELAMERKDLDTFPVPKPDAEDEKSFDPIMAASAILNLADLNLPSPGRLTVIAERGTEQLIIGRLKITHGPVPAFVPPRII